MKRLLIVGAILAAPAASTTAWAQALVGGEVAVEGSVAARCAIAGPGSVLLELGELAVVSGPAENLGQLDPTRLSSRTATLNAWCNTVLAGLSVEARPLEHATAADAEPGFARRIDFTATAKALGPDTTASDTTLTDGPGAQASGAIASEIEVSFSDVTTPAGGRLVAGPYAGSVMVWLTPTP